VTGVVHRARLRLSDQEWAHQQMPNRRPVRFPAQLVWDLVAEIERLRSIVGEELDP
jgi:hypothetical protein